MHMANYCAECGARLKRKGWRAWLNRRLCEDCRRRSGKMSLASPLAVVAIIAIAAFALGRYQRPAAPPLVIERAANSPLSDLPVNLNATAKSANRNTNSVSQSSDDRSAAPPFLQLLMTWCIFVARAHRKGRHVIAGFTLPASVVISTKASRRSCRRRN